MLKADVQKIISGSTILPAWQTMIPTKSVIFQYTHISFITKTACLLKLKEPNNPTKRDKDQKLRVLESWTFLGKLYFYPPCGNITT